jgi:linker histone H1 and H5 family
MATIKIIKEAIAGLKDRTGSSVPAITKWIETEKKVGREISKKLCNQILFFSEASFFHGDNHDQYICTKDQARTVTHLGLWNIQRGVLG